MPDYRTEAQKDRDARGMTLFAGQEITKEAYARIRTERSTVPSYIVIENTPGYLPEEDEPATFEDRTDALVYLSDRVSSYLDQLYDADEAADMKNTTTREEDMSATQTWVPCPHCDSTNTKAVSESLVKTVFVCGTCNRDFAITKEA